MNLENKGGLAIEENTLKIIIEGGAYITFVPLGGDDNLEPPTIARLPPGLAVDVGHKWGDIHNTLTHRAVCVGSGEHALLIPERKQGGLRVKREHREVKIKDRYTIDVVVSE